MKTNLISIACSGSLTLILLFCLILSGCETNPSLKEKISDLEKQYKAATEDNTVSIRSSAVTDIMKELAATYVAYAEKEATPEDAPTYLYNAAELYETNMIDPNKALAIFDQITKKYPTHDRAADALFRKGFIYHNVMKDLPNAKLTYQEFIDKYPDHQLRSSANFEINNLGKTPEQILKEIQLQNTSDSTALNTNPAS